MSSTQSILFRLLHLFNPFTISIVNSRIYPMMGKCVGNLTYSLPLFDIIYIPNFLINLLSNSIIT